MINRQPGSSLSSMLTTRQLYLPPGLRSAYGSPENTSLFPYSDDSIIFHWSSRSSLFLHRSVKIPRSFTLTISWPLFPEGDLLFHIRKYAHVEDHVLWPLRFILGEFEVVFMEEIRQQ